MTKQIDVYNSTALSNRMHFAQEANTAARQSAYADYRSRRAQNTLRRQDAELTNFGAYVGADDLAINPQTWSSISWGIIESFIKKILMDGYAVGSVNNHLSTIKTYAKLATKAGIIHPQEHAI